jgi:hypothetical protein
VSIKLLFTKLVHQATRNSPWIPQPGHYANPQGSYWGQQTLLLALLWGKRILSQPFYLTVLKADPMAAPPMATGLYSHCPPSPLQTTLILSLYCAELLFVPSALLVKGLKAVISDHTRKKPVLINKSEF